MFLSSITSILSYKKWLTKCLTFKFALALSDRTFGIERMVWYWGHFLLMKKFNVSNLPKTSFEGQDLALFILTWRIKWQGFLSSVGIRLCHIFSLVASAKLRTLTIPFFPEERSSRIPFITTLPAITVVFVGYWRWLVVVSQYLLLVLLLLFSLKA